MLPLGRRIDPLGLAPGLLDQLVRPGLRLGVALLDPAEHRLPELLGLLDPPLGGGGDRLVLAVGPGLRLGEGLVGLAAQLGQLGLGPLGGLGGRDPDLGRVRGGGVPDGPGLAVGVGPDRLGLGPGALVGAARGRVGLGPGDGRVLLGGPVGRLSGLVDLVAEVLGRALGLVADGAGLVLGRPGQPGGLLAEHLVVRFRGIGCGLSDLGQPAFHLPDSGPEHAQPLPRLVPLRGEDGQGAVDLLGRVTAPGNGEAVLGDGVAHGLFPSCRGLRSP